MRFKKSLAFFLAFCTCFSSVPTAALAETVRGGVPVVVYEQPAESEETLGDLSVEDEAAAEEVDEGDVEEVAADAAETVAEVAPAPQTRNQSLSRQNEVVPSTGWSGSGSESDPYLIQSANDLLLLANRVNDGLHYRGLHFRLTTDIDLSEISDWTPIGSGVAATIDGDGAPSDTSYRLFAGTFDGGSHTIRNLVVASDHTYNGLFGALHTATIKNLKIQNATVNQSSDAQLDYAGALAGFAYNSSIQNVTVMTGLFVKGRHYVGGAVGYAVQTQIYGVEVSSSEDASSVSAVDSGSSGTYGDGAGGLVGCLGLASTIENCSVSYVSVKGERQVGGLVGLACASGAIKTSSLREVAVTCTTSEVVSSNHPTEITCAGLVGAFNDTCGDVSGCSLDSVHVSDTSGGTNENVRLGIATAGSADSRSSTALPSVGVTMTTCSLGIRTESEFASFRDEVNRGNNYAGVTVTLIAILDFEGEEWEPIGQGTKDGTGSSSWRPFSGTFSCNSNKYIRNFTITATEGMEGVGLFGALDGATIKFLNVSGANISGTGEYVGAIAGYAYGSTFSSCSVSGSSVSGSRYVGGMVGYAASGSKVADSGVTGTTITGTRQVGGLAGMLVDSNISSDTVATVKIVCNATDAEATANPKKLSYGGLVGALSGTVDVDTCRIYETDLTWGSDVTAAGKAKARIGKVSGGTYAAETFAITDESQTITPGDVIAVTRPADAKAPDVKSELINGIYEAQVGPTKYATLAGALAAAGNNRITLLDDVVLNSTLTINGGCNIDLNNCNITAVDCRAFNITAGTGVFDGKGTISTTVTENTSLENTSSVIHVSSESQESLAVLTLNKNVTVSTDYCQGITCDGSQTVVVNVKGTVAVTGKRPAISSDSQAKWADITVDTNGTVSATQNYAIYNPQKGTTTIKGKVSGLGGIEAKAGTVTVNSSATITATADEQTHNADNNGPSTSGYAIAAVTNENFAEYPTVEIKGATINGLVVAVADGSAANNGVVTSTSNTVSIPFGYAWEKQTDDTYKLVERTVVAQIGDTNYESLPAAIAAANVGDTIVLLHDVTLEQTQTIDKDLTLDLNGYDVTAIDCRAFDIESGTVKFTDEGTISTEVSGTTSLPSTSSVIHVGGDVAKATFTLEKDVTVSTDYCHGITYSGREQQEVTINGTVAVTGTQPALSGSNQANNAQTDLKVYGTVSATQNYAIYNPQTGTTSIFAKSSVTGLGGIETKAGLVNVASDARITATATAQTHSASDSGPSTSGYAIAAVTNTSCAPYPQVRIYGENINGLVVALADGEAQNDGEVISSYNTLSVPFGYAWEPQSSNYKLVEKHYVAMIGETGYETLADAFAAANTGDTIVLLEDIALTATQESTKTLTLNLNGHTITATDARALWIKSGEVSITGSGTLSAGGDGLDETSSVIRVGDSADNSSKATLTIDENVTVSSDRCYGITTFGKNDTDSDPSTADIQLTVKGTVSVAATGETDAAISGNGKDGLSPVDTVIESGAKVTATNGVGIYQPGKGLLTIKDATITGATAVYVKSGQVHIQGATLEATGAAQDYSYNGNGCDPTGDALVVDNCGYPGGAAQVLIEDGASFTSANAKGIGAYYGNGETELATIRSKSDEITVLDRQMWVDRNAGLFYELVEFVLVSFDLNGGTMPEGITFENPEKIEKGTKAIRPNANPERDNAWFTGWFADGASTAFDFDTPVTEDLTLTAGWTVTDVDFRASISLNDSISLNAYAGVPTNYDANLFSYRVTDAQGTLIKSDSFEGLRHVTLTYDGVTAEYYYIEMKQLAAKEMVDEYILFIDYAGTETSTGQYYSIRDYCDRAIASDKVSQATKNVCLEALRYGSLAQLYFDYKTDDLADKNNKATDPLQPIPDSYEIDPSQEPTLSGVSETKMSASLEYTPYLNFFLVTDSTYEKTAGWTVTVSKNGQTYASYTTGTWSDGIYVQITGIAASEMTDTFEITVTNPDGDSATWHRSLTNYLYLAQGRETLQSLVRSMYAYCLAAKAVKS